MRAGAHLRLGALGGFAAARVWLSGLELGEFMGGFTGSSVDLTPHVRHRGKNFLALRLTNEHNPDVPPGRETPDYNLYGGIYREIGLGDAESSSTS